MPVLRVDERPSVPEVTAPETERDREDADLERCVFCDELRAPHEFKDGLRCVYCAEEQDA